MVEVEVLLEVGVVVVLVVEVDEDEDELLELPVPTTALCSTEDVCPFASVTVSCTSLVPVCWNVKLETCESPRSASFVVSMYW